VAAAGFLLRKKEWFGGAVPAIHSSHISHALNFHNVKLKLSFKVLIAEERGRRAITAMILSDYCSDAISGFTYSREILSIN